MKLYRKCLMSAAILTFLNTNDLLASDNNVVGISTETNLFRKSILKAVNEQKHDLQKENRPSMTVDQHRQRVHEEIAMPALRILYSLDTAHALFKRVEDLDPTQTETMFQIMKNFFREAGLQHVGVTGDLSLLTTQLLSTFLNNKNLENLKKILSSIYYDYYASCPAADYAIEGITGVYIKRFDELQTKKQGILNKINQNPEKFEVLLETRELSATSDCLERYLNEFKKNVRSRIEATIFMEHARAYNNFICHMEAIKSKPTIFNQLPIQNQPHLLAIKNEPENGDRLTVFEEAQAKRKEKISKKIEERNEQSSKKVEEINECRKQRKEKETKKPCDYSLAKEDLHLNDNEILKQYTKELLEKFAGNKLDNMNQLKLHLDQMKPHEQRTFIEDVYNTGVLDEIKNQFVKIIVEKYLKERLDLLNKHMATQTQTKKLMK